MTGETCILAAVLGLAALVSSLLRSSFKPELKLRLFCCSLHQSSRPVDKSHIVHSVKNLAPVPVYLVYLGKI